MPDPIDESSLRGKFYCHHSHLMLIFVSAVNIKGNLNLKDFFHNEQYK